jgi:type I restriction enzyme R subunit
MPVKGIEKLLDQLNETVSITLAYLMKLGIDLNLVLTDTNTFKNLSLFGDFANTIVGNDDVRNEFNVLANTVDSLYDSLRPDIFKMGFDPSQKEAILYLQGVVQGKIRPEKLEAVRGRISDLLDQSVLVAEEARTYTINESGKEIDISKIDIEELREKFKHKKNRNLEIADLREHIEKKLEQMLKRNITRTGFSERFRHIIDAYNAGGSQNDDFYEKILKFMEELREEEKRHIKEELSETELELFDLLRKEKLTQDEEKRVKLAAKTLYETLLAKKNELFIVGWQNDEQPKQRVKTAIQQVLNDTLPDCYDRMIFSLKRDVVFEHIVDQAMMGYDWVAA